MLNMQSCGQLVTIYMCGKLPKFLISATQDSLHMLQEIRCQRVVQSFDIFEPVVGKKGISMLSDPIELHILNVFEG